MLIIKEKLIKKIIEILELKIDDYNNFTREWSQGFRAGQLKIFDAVQDYRDEEGE